MIILLDTSDFQSAKLELAEIEIGQLLTPLTRRALKCAVWAVDNGCFSRFLVNQWVGILSRHPTGGDGCLFVAVPDIVGNARRTGEIFREFVECQRWNLLADLPVWVRSKLAIVAQDGSEDCEIPWKDLAAIFIGGTDRFKMSSGAIDIAKTARIMGKWVHIGRVNTRDRFERWLEIADSIDGTGISQYSWMRESICSEKPMSGLWESA